MQRSLLPIVIPLALLAAGCLGDESQTALVPLNPFGHSVVPETTTQSSYAPADLQSAARVDSIGHQLVTANKQLAMQPLFRTIGAPQPEIFHRGTTEVDVTEGLVKQCATDGQLAAVLSLELAKINVEREMRRRTQSRLAEQLPPLDLRVGGDGIGAFGPADQLQRAELAKFDGDRRRRQETQAPPPDAQALARDYLARAGYPPGELDAAQKCLTAAADNQTLARQLLNATPPGAAQPPVNAGDK